MFLVPVLMYKLHGKNVVHMTNSANGIDMHFFYDAQNRPAIVIYNGTAYYYMHNLQGDIIHLVDANGNNVVNYVYDAWGKKLSVTGSMAGSLGYWQPFRYRGYVYDEETGLYYLRSRYYHPGHMRFINPDKSMNIPRVKTRGTNLCAYCLNQPTVMADIEGLIEVKVLIPTIQEAPQEASQEYKELVKEYIKLSFYSFQYGENQNFNVISLRKGKLNDRYYGTLAIEHGTNHIIEHREFEVDISEKEVKHPTLWNILNGLSFMNGISSVADALGDVFSEISKCLKVIDAGINLYGTTDMGVLTPEWTTHTETRIYHFEFIK